MGMFYRTERSEEGGLAKLVIQAEVRDPKL